MFNALILVLLVTSNSLWTPSRSPSSLSANWCAHRSQSIRINAPKNTTYPTQDPDLSVHNTRSFLAQPFALLQTGPAASPPPPPCAAAWSFYPPAEETRGKERRCATLRGPVPARGLVFSIPRAGLCSAHLLADRRVASPPLLALCAVFARIRVARPESCNRAGRGGERGVSGLRPGAFSGDSRGHVRGGAAPVATEPAPVLLYRFRHRLKLDQQPARVPPPRPETTELCRHRSGLTALRCQQHRAGRRLLQLPARPAALAAGRPVQHTDTHSHRAAGSTYNTPTHTHTHTPCSGQYRPTLNAPAPAEHGAQE